jgi:hypothetical protein
VKGSGNYGVESAPYLTTQEQAFGKKKPPGTSLRKQEIGLQEKFSSL